MIKYKVKINLGIVTQGGATDGSVNYRVLVINGNETPHLFIYDNQNIDERLDKLFCQLIDAHAEWSKKIFCGIENKDGVINVNYICMIPHQINNKAGSWISIQDIISKESNIDENYKHIINHISTCYAIQR
tara:strand:+ start:2086 stop:2478 length:393 start_codon:yes stop_codon:yes gene_type:complete